ncbi:UNVERIFIED_CONTAM: hypothetical protein H355_012466 [Colinus virginianus]|nr:hypothetical protein H355_012466 [Colinus virginianus]
MTERANGDDFPVWDYHKKKKKKRKRRRSDVDRENGENEGTWDAELSCASPQLFEDQAAQGGEVSKKKKKKKNQEEEKKPPLNYSLAELEVVNEAVMVASQKKKKKRKQKFSESTDVQNDVACVPVNQNSIDSGQENDADNVYSEKSAKKRKQRKLPEEDGVSELPTSETLSKTVSKTLKKKKRRGSSTQGIQEDTDVTLDQSLLSSPDQKKQEEAMVSPSSTGEGAVAVPWCRGSAWCASPTVSEDSADVPVDFSKPAEKDKSSRQAAKVIKSKTYITDDSSSESDVMTPEATTSNETEDQNNSLTETTATSELSLEDEEFIHMLTVLDLDTAKRELGEFIPHVGQLSDHSIRKMAGRDLMRFKQFKKQGIAIKFGRFSKKENDQIKKNVEEFLAISGIGSAEKLLFTSRYPEEKDAISRLKAEHHFCQKLGKH